VLDAVVGDIVYRHFEGKREGFLTNTRSKLVSRETLGKLAKEMGISQLINSAGRSNSHNSYMNGNAFVALVGVRDGHREAARVLENVPAGNHVVPREERGNEHQAQDDERRDGVSGEAFHVGHEDAPNVTH
jgi:hypothetical protein